MSLQRADPTEGWLECRHELYQIINKMRGGDFRRWKKFAIKIRLFSFSQTVLREVLSWMDRDSQTVLHRAIGQNNFDLVDKLTDRLSDEELFTLLSSDNGGYGVVQTGLNAGYIMSISKLIARLQPPDICAILNQQVHSPRQRLNIETTILHKVIGFRDIRPAEILTSKLTPEHLSELLTKPDGKGETVLHIAMKLNRDDFVQDMLSKISVDNLKSLLQIQDQKGSTLFHATVERPQPKLIQCFIERLSADDLNRLMALSDRGGRHVLHLAAQLDHLNLYRLLSGSQSKVQLVKLLSNISDDGSSCLHWAVGHEWLDVVEEIIQNFLLLKEDISQIIEVRDAADNYTFGFFIKDMSREMKDLLEPYSNLTFVDLESVHVNQFCLVLDNRECYGVPARLNYEKETLRNVGFDTRFVSKWKRADLTREMNSFLSMQDNVNVVVMIIIGAGGDNFVVDADGLQLSTADIVSDMDRLHDSIPKVLIVDNIVLTTGHGQLNEMKSTVPLNFSLVTNTPSRDNKTGQFFPTFIDKLMKISRDACMSLDQMIKEAATEVKYKQVSGPKGAISKTLILRVPKMDVCAATYDISGVLIHSGNGYRMRLQNSLGCAFVPDITGTIVSLCESEGLLYCLTQESGQLNSYLTQVHTVHIATEELTRSVIMFQCEKVWHGCHILIMPEHILITTPTGVKIYTRNFKYVDAVRMNWPSYMVKMDENRLAISEGLDYVTCFWIEGTKMKADWSLDTASKTVRGLAYVSTTKDLLILDEYSELRIYSTEGEFKSSHSLKEIRGLNTCNMSIFQDQLTIASRNGGYHVYHIRFEDRCYNFRHWSIAY